MPLDRSALKSRAREVITTSNPRVVTVGLVYLLIGIVLSALGARVMSVNISESEAMNYLRYAANGNYEYALAYAETMTPPPTAYAINSLLMFISAVITAGFTIFLLNTLRNCEPCFGNLMDGFGIWWKVLVLNLLQSLLIGLWSLLLFVPGIIAHYRYAQALYILIDDPTKSPVQCLRESRIMMAGHKWELFMLDLSFIGWYLLGLIPYVGYAAQVWSVPYIGMTKAVYYETLTGSNVWSFSGDYSV